MSERQRPFDHDREMPLLMGYVDGELDPADLARLEIHLEACQRCQDEVRSFRSLQAVTGRLRLKEAPPEAWETFWGSVYNRVERGVGWIALGLGAAAILGFGLYQAALDLLRTPALPWFVKAGVGAVCVGLALLLVSVVRERIFVRARTRYKDIVR